ncbi:hypothetical protein [Crenobacter cavernae]|uniref:hypothetical protein n=1 Tax=Crenobacter cavernae TaxID=2290923 RepID=UPI00100EA653|nr:hypothetical protein [Crenobacter cavernae]
MKLGGWLRLWILMSVLYAIPIALLTWAEFPSVGRISHHGEFYDRLPKDSIEKLVGKGTSKIFFDPDEIGTDVEILKGPRLHFRNGVVEKGKGISQGFVDPDEIGDEVEMPNGHRLPFRSGVTEKDISAVANQYHDILKAEAFTERFKVIGYGFAAWLVPCIAAYILGWAIRWVYRGFRRDTSIRKAD